MPEQITVRLPKDLSGALEIASRKMKRRNSEIVRMAVRQFLQLTNADGRRPAERVRGLLGSMASGVPDLAERHRKYILESLNSAR